MKKRVQVNGKAVEVEAGATLLDAARSVGVRVPTLCHLSGYAAHTSCMVCLVQDLESGRLVPACSTPAEDGISIATHSPEVLDVRRGILGLLLSEHVGDCEGPCRRFCPAGMDIPEMIRRIGRGDMAGALTVVKEHIALPAVLGRICPAPCEKGCRRGFVDEPVAICLLKRFVADVDLFSASPWLPDCAPASGKNVAVIGAGPAGLAAASTLLCDGHACAVFDDHETAGGMLQFGVDERSLPRDVLAAEVATISRLGADFILGVRIGRDRDLASLREEFDAVVLATGPVSASGNALTDVETDSRGIRVDPNSNLATEGLFACGSAVRPSRMAVRALADGRKTAESVDRFLRTGTAGLTVLPYDSRVSRVTKDEATELAALVHGTARVRPDDGQAFDETEASAEAARCLHCECTARESCRLRDVATEMEVRERPDSEDRIAIRRILQNPDIVYEPGKCIKCGICVRIAERAREALGLTFIGRGFTVRVGVPFDRSLRDALRQTALDCAQNCPTGALARRREEQRQAVEQPPHEEKA